MRLKGLEPPRLSAPDPKSGAATNYATAALWFAGAKIHTFFSFTSPELFFCAEFIEIISNTLNTSQQLRIMNYELRIMNYEL